MSSGRISEDGNEVLWEVNQGRKIFIYSMKRLQHENAEDQIIIMTEVRDCSEFAPQSYSRHHLIINKSMASVFSHAFADIAKHIEGWYKDD